MARGKSGLVSLLFVFFLGGTAGIFIYSFSNWDEDNLSADKTYKISDFFGTMAAMDKFNTLETIDTIELNTENTSANITTKAADGAVLALIELKSDSLSNAALSFNSDQFVFTGFVYLNENRSKVETEINNVNFENVGENKYLVVLANKSAETEELSIQLNDGETTASAEVATVLPKE